VLAVDNAPVATGATTESTCLAAIIHPRPHFLHMAVDALDVAEGQTVLLGVVLVAPGGKMTFIAQKMKNTRAIIALEPNGRRARSMSFNIARCGVYNACIFRWMACRQASLK
jgi:tRNA (cytosine40_48-C5)-methyltransferase